MSGEHEQELYGDELGMGDYNEGQEIPVGNNGGGDEQMGQQGGESDTQELEAMKKRLKEMEEEAAKLKASQQQQGSGTPGPAGADAAATPTDEAKAEADSRSIYVGNVDYSCTPEELQQHFQSCGTVNRVTILTDKGGNPKGFAYVEFLEIDAVSNAILLDGTELRGRPIKVTQKRTNRPGLKQRGRGRGRGGFSPYGRGGFFPYPYPPMPFPMPFPMPTRGGYAPRGRGRGRGFYSPY